MDVLDAALCRRVGKAGDPVFFQGHAFDFDENLLPLAGMGRSRTGVTFCRTGIISCGAGVYTGEFGIDIQPGIPAGLFPLQKQERSFRSR